MSKATTKLQATLAAHRAQLAENHTPAEVLAQAIALADSPEIVAFHRDMILLHRLLPSDDPSRGQFAHLLGFWEHYLPQIKQRLATLAPPPEAPAPPSSDG